jgi:dolichyl-phosphate beta-glucosyltransferase
MTKVFLSVVIPSYDEMANLQKGVLGKVANFLNKKKWKYEVIIVDDGSKDGSVEFVEEFVKEHPYFKLIKNSHLGKAGAVTAGVLASVGEHILFTDMDQATPIEEIDKLLPYFDSSSGEYDIVIGSRKSQRRGAPWTRHLMANGMIFLRSSIVGISNISDTQCGFKMFRRETAFKLFKMIKKLHNNFQEVSGSTVSAGFDVELLHLAEKMGYTIKEVPVNWLYVETRRVSPLRDSIEGFLDLLKIKLNDMRGEYN